MIRHDAIVIGGGMVGSAIAWGLARIGVEVTVLDGTDQAERAARANFGLIWGQSKGDSLPEYAHWTQEAIHLWPEFQDDLLNLTGVYCGFNGNGGLHLCVTEEELENRRALFERMSKIIGSNSLDLQILDHHQVAEFMPGIGPEVVGAGYCGQDGDVSPHAMLLAMHRAISLKGGKMLSNHTVQDLKYKNGIWHLTSGDKKFETPCLILAAGTANKILGERIGIDIPVFGLKGQILVTERITSRLSTPSHKIRQTDSGTLLLGDSKEPNAGLDDRSTSEVIKDIAQRCIKMLPWLSDVNLVRAWGGIRSMTDDGYPIYDNFPDCPGLFVANCHSGVTLAPIHAMRLAPMIADELMTPQIAAMSSRRFHV
ncbi:MAG: FAD-binding oxidoreductase [Hyphomicrobiales bacterium]